jgi:hypothetical protein
MSKPISALTLISVGALMLSSLAASSALAALPNILPTTAGITFHSEGGTSGMGSITSGMTVGTAETTGTEGDAGIFKTTFEKAKQALLGTCTSVGQASGSILVEGTYKVVAADLHSKEIAALLLLLNPQVEFTCGATSFALAGCVAGELTRASELSTLLTTTFNVVGSDNEIISYLNASDEPEACQLITKIGAGSTELSSLQMTQNLSKFTESGKNIEALLML